MLELFTVGGIFLLLFLIAAWDRSRPHTHTWLVKPVKPWPLPPPRPQKYQEEADMYVDKTSQIGD